MIDLIAFLFGIFMTTYDQLLQILTALNPTFVALENESHNHHGYFDGKESHFKLTIASCDFDGLNLVKRHQKIYALASPLMTAQGGTIHALAIHAYAPDEWEKVGVSPDSPVCASKNKG